jgi:hypothetical protein
MLKKTVCEGNSIIQCNPQYCKLLPDFVIDFLNEVFNYDKIRRIAYNGKDRLQVVEYSGSKFNLQLFLNCLIFVYNA